MTAPTAAALDALAAWLLADTVIDRGGPNYEPLRVPPSTKHLEIEAALTALRAKVETLIVERDNLLAGLNSIVHCKSGVTRPALREAAAEVLGRRVERWSEDQSPFVTLANEATARALASDTARERAEAALAEARSTLHLAEVALTTRIRRGLTTGAEMSAEQASMLVDAEPTIIAIRRARAALEQKP